jgi:DNA-directed RNA polymerase beta' subunit
MQTNANDKDEKKAEPEEEKESFKRPSSITSQLESFYTESVRKNPAVKDIRKHILTSKSLYEAVKKVEAFKKRDSEMVKLTESTKSKGIKIEPYKFSK